MNGIGRKCIGFLQLAVLVAAASCTSFRALELEVLRPAGTADLAGRRLAVTDLLGLAEDSGVEFQDDRMFQELAWDFADGMNAVLAEMGEDTVLSVSAAAVPARMARKSVPDLLPPDSVRRACGGADYLLVLEKVCFDLLETEGSLKISLTARLYDRESGLAADSAGLSAMAYLPEAGEGQEGDGLYEGIRAAYWDMGGSFARRICPYWEKVWRRVYVSGKYTGLGVSLWQEGRTEEACRLWRRELEHGGKEGFRAGMNLALAMEVDGRFGEALEMLEHLRSLREKAGRRTGRHFNRYMDEIRDRIREYRLLVQ